MLMRELCKPGASRKWQLYVADNVVVENSEDGSSTHWGQSGLEEGMKVFESTLASKLKKGWTETEKSLSRRMFQHVEKKPGKFWIVCINGNSVEVQYGKITKNNWSMGSGQTRSANYNNREAVLKAYEKMIAEKLVEGYEETHQRTTDYSHLGQSLAEKKRATPKPVRAVKEIPAEENLAKVLGDRPKQVVNTEVTHRIDLDPTDWYWASWKPWKPLPRPEPKPFDQDACVRRVAKLGKYDGQSTIDALKVPKAMTAEEGRFWFEVILSIDVENPPKVAVEKVAEKNIDVPLDRLKITNKLKQWKGYSGSVGPVLRCLSSLLSARECLEVLLDAFSTGYWSGQNAVYAEFLTVEVLVYLSDSELNELRKIVLNRIDPDPTAKKHHTYPLSYHVAARLRCHDEMIRLVGSWSNNGSSVNPVIELTFLFSLGDPKIIEAEVRRLGVPYYLKNHLVIRNLLATTEVSALDLVRDMILEMTNKERCEQMMEVFAMVKAPEAAPYMLELSQSAKSPKLAREWLSTEVGNAVAGLIPVAAGQGKLAEAALAYLREKNREGHAGIISKALKSATAEVATKIQSHVLDRVEKVYVDFTPKTTPPWLAKAAELAAAQKPLPGADFVQIAQLSAVTIEGKRLNPEQMASLLLALQNAQPGAAGELLSGLKKNADHESLDAFAWSLFEQWLAEGGPPKQKWAMRSLGVLGSDSVALKLTPLIRAWPGESQHPRAVLGLECLRAIGTDTALMQLNGIAVKLKFKALQNKARELMEAIAIEKGLTAAQLEDRIVPDCDLDERGTRVFDFGPRQFRFVLGPEMKPMLKDAEGKVKTDLPKPGAKDETAKAEAATTEWKLLKKQIKDVATVQVQRLEQAMVTGRRWPVVDFETLLVKHPLMTNLTRLVLWGGYDKKGELKTTFRVTDDRSYADANDGPCSLKSIDTVGIAHPLHLSVDQKSAWGEIFSDYEILPPFPQLGRLVYAFDKGELQSNTITRFGAIKIPATTLVFGLEKFGWTRGLPQDNGQLNGHSKYFPTADLSAVVIFEDGVPVGYREGWEDQTIKHIYFVPGQHRVTWGRSRFSKEKTVALREIDPVIASEILNDLSALAAKGK